MKLYLNHPAGSQGGPAVFVTRFIQELQKRQISYSLQSFQDCTAALLMISTQGILDRLKQSQIKSIYRTSGFYIPTYWNGQFGRIMTGEKLAHNHSLKVDITKVDFMVYQSLWSKTMCDQYLVKRDHNFAIIHNGTNLNLFKPTIQKQTPLTLLVVGNLRAEQSLKIPLRVIEAVCQTYPTAKLVFVGRMNELCLKLFNAQKAAYIEKIEHVENSELPKIYQQADLLLHPTQGDVCPNVVVEALASGLPVVTAKWGGAIELARDAGAFAEEKQNWAYSEEYIQSFIAQTHQILADLEQYKRKARQIAEQYLNVDDMVNKYLSLL